MTVTITPKNATETQVHRWFAEASTLGLKPGEWPPYIATTLGNGQYFRRESAHREDGEIVGVRYMQTLGCISILIAND